MSHDDFPGGPLFWERDKFFVDPAPILLCELLSRPAPKGSGLELYAVMETAHLKAARTETMKKRAARGHYFALYVGGFDPYGAEGQRCRLEMRALKGAADKGAPSAPAPKPGSRERQLGRMRQKVSRKLDQTYLYGEILSKRLTHLLRELADTAGGTLEHVAVVIWRTPRFAERWPEWTVFLAISPCG